MILKWIRKEKQKIFIIGILVLWAAVTILKYGGQSLIVHYLWPFIAGGALIFLFNKKWLKNKIGLTHILALLALAFFLISFIFDLTPSNGSLELMNIGFGLVLAFILSNEDWKDDSIKWLFIGLILVVCVVDIWGMALYAGGHPFNRLAGPLMKPNEAFSGYPNLLANLNLLVLLPALYFFNEIKKESRIVSLGVILANVVIITSLILTFSRAAWLSAVVIVLIAGIVLLIKHYKVALKYTISGLIIILLSIGTYFGINQIRAGFEESISAGDKISFQSEDEGSSVTERIASFERGIEMALQHPLTGVGSGSFNYISQSYEQNFSTLSSYPYSLPIKIMAENGLLSFGLLFAWLAFMWIYGFRKSKKYNTVILLTTLMLVLHHSIDNNLDFFSASLPLFLLIGISWPEAKLKSNIQNSIILIIISVTCIAGVSFALYDGYNGMSYIKARNAAGANNHQEAYDNYLNSTSLLFNRDARLAAALSAYELSKISDQEGWLTNARQQAFNYSEVDNPYDKRGHLLMARIFNEQLMYSQCSEKAADAQKVGGGNDFEIDYYMLACSLGEGDTDAYEANIKIVIPKLEKYFELLKVNSHMTILTDNPKFAVKILDLITQDFPEYTPLLNDMRKIAIMETEKFHEKYEIEAEINL